ncbi:MAG: hypothetical protein OHK0039_13920 [Bacteroidia bacterium]
MYFYLKLTTFSHKRTPPMMHLLRQAPLLLLLCSIATTTVRSQIGQYKTYFEEAYRLHPSIPPGLLEAVAYTSTRVNHLQPIGSCQDLPTYYGVMGLVEDGKGYFQNSLLRVAELSGYAVEEIKADPRINILAYASAYAKMQTNKRMTARSVDAHEPILAELTEIPQDNSPHNAFALDQQFYSILREMESPHTDTRFRVRQAFDYKTIFGEENLRVLSADWVQISEDNIRSNNGANFRPRTVGLCTPTNTQPDYSGAIWAAAHKNNYGSRDGETVKYVTIHTIQGSYASAISWFKNANARVSTHYVIRASDGQVTQMVCEGDKAYHVRTDNATTIGIEHEGFIDDGGSWYTNEMYESSAALVRDLCRRYGIDPLKTYGGPPTRGVLSLTNTCYHVKGHQHFRGNDHIDPGPFWDWDRYYRLINPSPSPATFTAKNGEILDPGGADGNYGDQLRLTYLIKPVGATSITLNFESFDLEGTSERPYDYLDIFDGENENGRYIGRFSGSTPPPAILSQSGAVFMEFRSDCQVNKAGWRLRYQSRGTTPDCPAPTELLAGNIFPMGVTLSWQGKADMFLVYLRRNLENKWTLYRTPANSVTITGLSANGLYQWQVQGVCRRDTSALIGNAFTTPNIGRSGQAQVFTVNLRAGRFHDSGGTFSGYADNENYLYRIIPPGGGQVELLFEQFEVEADHDFLTVYDGTSVNGTKLGTFTGRQSPGRIVSQSGALTLHFQSDNRTNGPGWSAAWRTIGGDEQSTTPTVPDDPQPDPDRPQPDPDVPVATGNLDAGLEYAASSPVSKPKLEAAYERSFNLTFEDTDRSGRGLANQFYNIAQQTATGIRANPQAGFFYDDFDSGLRSDWKQASGTWQVTGGVMQQTNASLPNTNLHADLRQTGQEVYVYHWTARMSGNSNNRRHGIHFFCSAPGNENRGNSYFVWVRDTETEDFVEIYKTVNDQFDRKMVNRIDLKTGQAYDYKVIYNPQKGRIEVYINNKFTSSWVDRYPLTTGKAISLRSGNCQVAFDNLAVFKTRTRSVKVSVGTAGADLPGEGPFVVHSLVVDRNLRWSPVGRGSSRIGQAGSSPVTPLPGESGMVDTTLRSSYKGDFSLFLPLPAAARGYYLPADYDGTRWAANTGLGFFYDECVGQTLAPWWKQVRGAWSMRDNAIQQSDETADNSNLYAPLRQRSGAVYLYHWRSRVLSSGDNRRFGLHFFASDGSGEQRGDSYMVWFRYHESKPDLAEVYRFDNNSQPRIRASAPVSLARNQWYDCKVVYDPGSGIIEIYLDNTQVLRWKDDQRPLASGEAVSLRTGNCQAAFDDLRVYLSHTATPVRLTVGERETAMFRHKSQGTAPAARVLSLTQGSDQRWSAVRQQETRIE